jgi:hypothetical protein
VINPPGTKTPHSSNTILNPRFLHQAVIVLITILISAACAPQATPSAGDLMATNIAMGVIIARTRTAQAPTATRTATPTHTPLPPTVTPTQGPIQPPVVVNFANCWLFGPGYSYSLDSHIKSGKQVQLIGVGSTPGWYIIINPYYGTPCWIQAADLSIDPNMDLSQFPLMTPFPLSPTPS